MDRATAIAHAFWKLERARAESRAYPPAHAGAAPAAVSLPCNPPGGRGSFDTEADNGN